MSSKTSTVIQKTHVIVGTDSPIKNRESVRLGASAGTGPLERNAWITVFLAFIFDVDVPRNMIRIPRNTLVIPDAFVVVVRVSAFHVHYCRVPSWDEICCRWFIGVVQDKVREHFCEETIGCLSSALVEREGGITVPVSFVVLPCEPIDEKICDAVEFFWKS